jgi:glutamate/aspartate transport system ATP-binding protein
MSQTTSMIELQSVNKWYGPHFQVLTNCSLNVAKGEVVVICGPSGSGKSTLIKCVNALETIGNGVITVNGVEVTNPKTDMPKLRSRGAWYFSISNSSHI